MLAPRLPVAPLALPPAGYPPAGQGQEPPTLVVPPPGTPFPEQEPALLPAQYRRAPWEQPTSIDLRLDPNALRNARQEPQVPPPAAGRHANPARPPDMAQYPYPAQNGGPLPGKRRKPQ